MNHSDARTQANTLEVARSHGHHWSQRDLDTLKDALANGHRDRETAFQLGRSLYAVRSAKRVVTERVEHKLATRRPVLPYDLGYTSLEEMGF